MSNHPRKRQGSVFATSTLAQSDTTARAHSPALTANRSRPAGAPLISACLIVKDEERALPDCFESLHELVDEVVVYDTGSGDSTVDLCRRAGARVFEGYWDDDFARARNAALSECRGDWVLWIDADERVRCPNVAQLRAGLSGMRADCDAISVEIHNLGDDPISASANNHRALRLFRRSRCQWYGSIHEQIDLHPGVDEMLMVVPLNGAYIEHIGYRNEVVESRNKLERNLKLAEAAVARPMAMRGQEGAAEMNLGRALAALGRFEEAQPWFERAVEAALAGVTRRASLMFSAQNLIALERFNEAIEIAQQLAAMSEQTGVAKYMEGVALRRLGRTEEAIAVLEEIDTVSNEDGFIYPPAMLEAELSSAYLDAGRTEQAADHLAALFESAPQVNNVQALIKVFAATGRTLDQVVAAMPEDRLERVAAALLIVEPSLADPVAEALFKRFGPKAPVLAAAIKFAPMVQTDRALEWSHRLRAIGMAGPCPLVAQAQIEVLDVKSRVRAALSAYAAFSDPRGEQLALALAPGLHQADIAATLQEVGLLAPALLPAFASAAARPGAADAGPVGSADSRHLAVSAALAALGLADLAQYANEPGPPDQDHELGAQLAGTGADR
ncbi:MAG TPA: glycosyltransferase [Acidimicrobiales bacterium]|nr:glycosyltransferase [Acidimicrobiales bacterium]